MTIDLFFRTLAQAYGQRAVCVILSGTDSDGVIGLKHIRAQGGLTIAQDPNEAEHDSMPVTAISTGMVDWVLPVAQLAPKLLEFVNNENRMKLPPEIPEADEPDVKVKDAPGGETVSDETRDPKDEEAIVQVLSDLRAQTGHDFTHYKRATILRRIARRMQVNSLESIPQYVGFIRTHPMETRALLQDLLIGVTHFFRDRDAFAALEAHIPQLFAGKKKDDEVRVWVTACATGEEAYSVAMLLCEHCNRLEHPPRVQIFATDIDEQSIADARDGLYPVDDRGGRLAGAVARVLREGPRPLPGAEGDPREGALRRAQSLEGRALLALRPHLLPQPAHLSERQGAGAGVRRFPFRPARRRPALPRRRGESHARGNRSSRRSTAKHRLFVRRSTPRPVWKVPTLPLRTGGEAVRQPSGWRARPLPPLTHSNATDASAAAPDAPQAGHVRREVLFGELHLRLLEEYGPPSVVVNDAHEIVHLSPKRRTLPAFRRRRADGEHHESDQPRLQIELRTALFRAAQSKESVAGAPKRVHFDGSSEVITLLVRPMKSSDEASGFFLVLFQKEGEPAAGRGRHLRRA